MEEFIKFLLVIGLLVLTPILMIAGIFVFPIMVYAAVGDWLNDTLR